MQRTAVWRGYNNALRRVGVRIAALAAVGVLLAPLTAYAGSITLEWDPSPEWFVAGYVVYYRTSSGLYSDSASLNVGNQTTAVINGLTNGVTYHFVVKAYSEFEVFSASSDDMNGGLPFSQPPTITNPGNMTVIKGSFTLPISASDPEGDPLAYSATGLPSGLLINPMTGVISGNVTPGASDITANASDGRTPASVTFTLTVVNQAPTITPPGDRTVRPGAFTLPITASDPDGDSLMYSAPPNGLPPGLTINAQTGEISGTVALGTYAVAVTASDESANASVTFTLRVVISPFTDDPLTAGVHVMRTVHITELRTRIDSLRVMSGLSAAAWIDATLGSGSTPIKAIHITQLRSALNAVYSARKLPLPMYTDPALAAGSTVIKAAHISELRAAVAAVE